ncbi:hypothetical protein EHQ76_07140 [Leptospira barantonii]|uniref:GNAT family N-acetyltransferase n=1 Tax=Leptospira barantonii TaxID=2023184 RepID=A0A5F2BGW1_9LEPT|nr:hypothetical protein [Leptospira barantonii]TGM04815.1 hypothetical protein EHQ76_07140 [Leptospira barantonii]
MNAKTLNNNSKEIKQRSKKEGFKLHIWETGDDPQILIAVKEFGKGIYREAGYSNYQTVDLDRWSRWFFVTYDDVLQASTRIVRKTKENLIPLEIALRETTGEQYRVSKLDVADWNSVTFRKTIIGAQSFKIASRAVAKYCLEQKFSLVYGMINPKWEGLYRVYFDNGAITSKEFSDYVFYPGCLLNGELALFRLLEIGEKTLQKIAANL